MYSPGIGIGIIPRMSVTSVSVVTATVATGIGITSFTANWNAFSGAQYYLLDVSTSSSFSTFVYQDQVVLAPTTSYVVIGLTENTTYYYRVRAAVGVDEDAVAFFGRVYAASGSLTYTEVTATQTLVADMKTNGIWTPMKAIYPMVGASAEACKQNLKSSSFTGTFTSGWTFASTGVTPNGTSAYMDTGIVPNIEFATNNDGNYGYYHRTALKTASFVMGTSNPYFGDYSNSASNCYPSINDGNSVLLSVSQTTLGFRQLSRDPSSVNTINYRLNNTNYNCTQASTGKSILSIKIGAVLPTYFSNVQLAFAYIGDTKLTTTEMSNYFSAVNTFQTTLSRQV